MYNTTRLYKKHNKLIKNKPQIKIWTYKNNTQGAHLFLRKLRTGSVQQQWGRCPTLLILYAHEFIWFYSSYIYWHYSRYELNYAVMIVINYEAFSCLNISCLIRFTLILDFISFTNIRFMNKYQTQQSQKLHYNTSKFLTKM